MSDITSISLSPVLVVKENAKTFSIPLMVQGEGENTNKKFELEALIDSGAGGTFLDWKTAEKYQLELCLLTKPIKVFNVDGTKNKEGLITHCVWMKLLFGNRKISCRFYISGLGKEQMILGLPWLKQYNPVIDWQKKTIKLLPHQLFPTLFQLWNKRKDQEQTKSSLKIAARKVTVEDITPEEENVWIQAKTFFHNTFNTKRTKNK